MVIRLSYIIIEAFAWLNFSHSLMLASALDFSWSEEEELMNRVHSELLSSILQPWSVGVLVNMS